MGENTFDNLYRDGLFSGADHTPPHPQSQFPGNTSINIPVWVQNLGLELRNCLPENLVEQYEKEIENSALIDFVVSTKEALTYTILKTESDKLSNVNNELFKGLSFTDGTTTIQFLISKNNKSQCKLVFISKDKGVLELSYTHVKEDNSKEMAIATPVYVKYFLYDEKGEEETLITTIHIFVPMYSSLHPEKLVETTGINPKIDCHLYSYREVSGFEAIKEINNFLGNYRGGGEKLPVPV